MPDDPDARALLRRHPAYEPTTPPAPPKRLPPPPRVPSEPPPEETPSFAVRAARTPLARLLVLIAAAATALAGVIAAIGSATTSIIGAVADAKARRTNVEIDNRLNAVETRVNGDFGVTLETQTRQKKDEELAAAVDGVRAELKAHATTPRAKAHPAR